MNRPKLETPSDGQPVGYTALQLQYQLDTIPNWHESVITTARRTHLEQGRVFEEFPASYDPGDGLGEQLEFALKYDGLNLEILAALFAKIPRERITSYVKSRPTGKYARTIWYLYEMLTGEALPLNDLDRGNYVDLLDDDKYYTAPARRVGRQRIRDNLLGSAAFSPTIRRTETLTHFEQEDFSRQCAGVAAKYPADTLRRALSYLYTKETKSSFEIEHAAVDASRTQRFVTLLKNAEREDYFNKPALIELQNQIVDDRYREFDFRQEQNYIGETIGWREKIHFVAPQPDDVSSLMEGMFALHAQLEQHRLHPVIHAAIVSFGFVYVHPFIDGNGRIHRFLVHNILSRRGFTPEGLIFPISAAMLRNMSDYDGALETLSRPLLALIQFELDHEGKMTVAGETAAHYRYLDLTAQTEALFQFIQRTIEIELPEELNFLQSYDATKRGIQEVVDLPDRLIDLFIRFCLQNNGRLSGKKGERYFAELTDDEIRKLEEVVRRHYAME